MVLCAPHPHGLEFDQMRGGTRRLLLVGTNLFCSLPGWEESNVVVGGSGCGRGLLGAASEAGLVVVALPLSRAKLVWAWCMVLWGGHGSTFPVCLGRKAAFCEIFFLFFYF